MTAVYALTNMGHSSMPNGLSSVGIGNLSSDIVDGVERAGSAEGAWISM